MNIRTFVRAAAITTLFVAGSAAAQVVPPGGVSITTTPATSVTPGTLNSNLGTVQLSGNSQGTVASTIPVTITANGGGSLSNLSNCRLVNSSGTAVTNNISTVSSGTNTFTFSPALSVGGSAGTSSLSLRCDVAANTPSGATFSFSAPMTANANLGSVSISGNAQGTLATSLPISISAANGGSASNLSNCALVNSNGVAVTNTLGGVSAGTNTFTFTGSGLFVGGTTGTANLTLRCDIAANTPSGATFQSVAGTPVFVGSASAPLSVNLDTAPSVPAGSTNVALSNISLGANSTDSIRISAIPLSISAGAGASTADLVNCSIINTNNVGGSLSAAQNVSTGGTTNFVLSAPLTVFAGTAPMLALSCDVQPVTPVGGTFTIGVDPASVTATNVTTGAAVTPTAVVGVGPNGLPASLGGTVIVSGDTGTGTGTGTGTSTGTPGIPNTGAGDTMNTLFVLAISGLVALVSGLYLRRSLR